ncbi:MAG: hypothetical protein M3160_08830, partial [Candidatus Eremiobacteraeota bacterium]|nr:hypothetical protein [Candidatus Eremiobacteraeota bacterium]
TVLVPSASVTGTSPSSVFYATNNGTGPEIQALSVGGRALNVWTASARGLALLARNTATTGGSAIIASSFGNAMQASSLHANGLLGVTKLIGTGSYNAAGVLGLDTTSSTFNQGVKGVSTNGTGVLGISKRSAGVMGEGDANTGGTGLIGIGTVTNFIPGGCGGETSTGVEAFGEGSSASLASGMLTALNCYTAYGTGLTTEASGVGVLAQGHAYQNTCCDLNPGTGIQAQGSIGALIIGEGFPGANPPALQVEEQQDPGLIMTAHGPSGGMSLDTSGNLVISGTLTQRGTPAGLAKKVMAVGESFAGNESSVTIASIGEAQLSSGAIFVKISPTFARRIDPTSRYEVFLTPNGPTMGLYTAQRSSGGFIVRENPGGHSNTAFSYRIVAKALEQSSTPLQGTSKPHFAKPTNLTFSRRMLKHLRDERARYFHGPQLFQQ